MTGYCWMFEKAPDRFIERTYQWMDHVGLGDVLTLKELKAPAYWTSDKQRNTKGVRRIGTYDQDAGASYSRSLDPSAYAHEILHGNARKWFKHALAEKGELAKTFDEPLAFLLQTAGFGDEEFARTLLGQSQSARSAYTPGQGELGNWLVRGYYVMGRDIFSTMGRIISGKEAGSSVIGSSRGSLVMLRDIALNQGAEPEKYRLALQQGVRANAISVVVTDPAAYLTSAFKVPKKVADYVVRQCGFETAQEAALSLASMKIEALDAHRAIASRLFIIGGQSIEQAEEEAGRVVIAGASRPILNGLDNLSENLAALYEFGFSEQEIRGVTQAALTRPGYTRHLTQGLENVLKVAGDAPLVGRDYLKRYAADMGFREFISRHRGGEALNDIKRSLGVPIAQETLRNLLQLPIGEGLRWDVYSNPEAAQYALAHYEPDEEFVLWKNLPPLLAICMLSRSLDNCNGDDKHEGSRTAFIKAVTGGTAMDNFTGYGNGNRLVEHVHDKARSMPGGFEANVSAVTKEVFGNAKAWLEANQPHTATAGQSFYIATEEDARRAARMFGQPAETSPAPAPASQGTADTPGQPKKPVGWTSPYGNSKKLW